MMIDFHSHILPDFDDGANDVNMSMAMLSASKAMGVDVVVSTSHCYPTSSRDVDKFLSERDRAYSGLKEAYERADSPMPEIRMGSEVHLIGDLTRFKRLKELCVADTNYMLVEMPMSPWNDDAIDNLYKLSISGIKPIIAHAERNLSQTAALLDSLYELDILIQINSESFGMSPLKKFTDGMMRNKMIHIIGTDMHNMTTRRPTMDRAKKYISKRFGDECWEYLMGNAQTILNGEEISYRSLRGFKKRGIF